MEDATISITPNPEESLFYRVNDTNATEVTETQENNNKPIIKKSYRWL